MSFKCPSTTSPDKSLQNLSNKMENGYSRINRIGTIKEITNQLSILLLSTLTKKNDFKKINRDTNVEDVLKNFAENHQLPKE